MIVEPKVKGFICTTAHPKGCAESVRRQIEFAKSKGRVDSPVGGEKPRVLVIGSSTGYGLASRIAVAYGYGADTMGVAFEKPSKPEKRTASAGWYNTEAFEKMAAADGLYARSFNGDGFSEEMKDEVIDAIKADWGKVDMVIYSLAAPRRTVGDKTVSSVLKTTGSPYTNRTLDLRTNEITEVTVPVADDDEIRDTIAVMGGDDWERWIERLCDADVLSEGAITLAYSYIGPTMTHPIYKDGSIGQAKKDLYDTAKRMTEHFSKKGLHAYISVNKALVTQSSAAIPIVPLYISLLYKVMKEQGVHEGCIEQMVRLYTEKLPAAETDESGFIRMDDKEMDPAVQDRVADVWEKVSTENIASLGDIDGYWEDFYHMFGFKYDNVDYNEDVEV
ncbi:MAG TPA: bifunctional NADH-specific enoyl-ACP reductase/trans-2-enoyl-CoA reductase [Lachnospiraceae bacterium]|nr:bifunctional NADH-specific enoyl-ACP reductase/trans-2-enoyl-CoA reductase [Lachnospiraceae bacterium]